MPYRALISSDWNECLAPCGPFDAIAHAHPHLAGPLKAIFRQYTGNTISLGQAATRIQEMVPGLPGAEQMDAYLDAAFATYRGVPEFLAWCAARRIALMIATTGMIGYFQRVFARGLLGPPPFLAAHPLIRYPAGPADPPQIFDLFETADKACHTQQVATQLELSFDKVVIIGDSGGDGPHFEWGARVGAHRVGCMTKPSLGAYCQARGITIPHLFGVVYNPGQPPDRAREMGVDFMALAGLVEELLG
jgi:phosphoglycolate phosphatase-like HAD superfamily hydrolase